MGHRAELRLVLSPRPRIIALCLVLSKIRVSTGMWREELAFRVVRKRTVGVGVSEGNRTLDLRGHNPVL